MEKLSNQQISDLLSKSAQALRALTTERDHYRAKCAQFERRGEAEKVASLMHEKGLRRDVEYDDLVASLEKAASEGKLQRIADAVDLAGPDMTDKIAHITSDGPQAHGLSDFERMVMS